jgi:hypothetical protein
MGELKFKSHVNELSNSNMGKLELSIMHSQMDSLSSCIPCDSHVVVVVHFSSHFLNPLLGNSVRNMLRF